MRDEHRFDWRVRAACRDIDPERFTITPKRNRVWQFAAELALCKACPVIAECRALAEAGRTEGQMMAGVLYRNRNDRQRRALAS